MLKALAKRLLKHTPYRVVQTGLGNRFAAIDDAMSSLKLRGYRPKVILDGGANVGEFASLVHTLWPEAVIHAVEPQPGCMPLLMQRTKSMNMKVHKVALGPTDGKTLSLAASASSTSTGAHVLLSDSVAAAGEVIEVPVETIDNILQRGKHRDERTLIKLDLQGFELEALKGALQSLPNIEVILTEISFYAQAYEPPIEELVAFLYSHGFRIYDVASIMGRRRDNRAHQGDLIFVAGWSELLNDRAWT